MDRQEFPPELMAILGNMMPGMDPSGPGSMPPGPPLGMFPPELGIMPPELGMDPGIAGNPAGPGLGMDMGLPSLPMLPGPSTSQIDPVLMDMLFSAPEVPRVREKKKLGIPQPDRGQIYEFASIDEREWRATLWRMSRDLAIYRQAEGGIPSDFDIDNDVQAVSAAMSNLVNKLSNMMGAIDPYFEVQAFDEQSEEAAQAVENFCYFCRDYERRTYAQGFGNPLQRDEFWYLLLYGRIVWRVLPDLSDDHYPFVSSLLDPSTCFPYFGSDKDGMLRMTRVYTTTVAKMLSEYTKSDPTLEARIIKKLGYEEKNRTEFYNTEGKVIEYWDKQWRAVYFMDIEVMAPREHGYGFVPFIYVTAVGEPKAVQTPKGQYVFQSNDFNSRMHFSVSRDVDQAEKGVSVLHYLINTHRLREALMTLLYLEIEKASAPSTITYTAPQLAGREPPPMDYRKRANNQRVMGLQVVEGVPTSPHPTDVAPFSQMVSEDWYGGALNPAGMGQQMGANASGYSLDVLIATAREMILPYMQAYENGMALKFQMKLQHYTTIVGPLMSMRIPQQTLYGRSNAFTDLSVEMVELVGPYVKVEMKNITEQNMPILMQTAQQAMAAGIWSQRYAMSQTGIRNPDKMFADILAEKALQHPAIMEMFAIPSALIDRGAEDLAQLWAQLVLMPQGMQAGALGAGNPMAAPGPEIGSGAPAPPQGNGGQARPTSANRQQAPGGPAPGQGRGPAR